MSKYVEHGNKHIPLLKHQAHQGLLEGLGNLFSDLSWCETSSQPCKDQVIQNFLMNATFYCANWVLALGVSILSALGWVLDELVLKKLFRST